MASETLLNRLIAAQERAIANAAAQEPEEIVFYAGAVDGIHYGRLVPSVADAGGTQKFPLVWNLAAVPPIDTAVATAIAGNQRIAVGF